MAPDRSILEDLGIIFEEYDPNDTERKLCPPQLEETFKAITSIGRTRYRDFQGHRDGTSRLRPWRRLLKRRADKIAECATDCLTNFQNEPEWRLKLEHHILARFQSEFIWYMKRPLESLATRTDY